MFSTFLHYISEAESIFQKQEWASSLPWIIIAQKIPPTVRVIFLPENHRSQEDRYRNAAFLKDNYSFTRGDIILVEDDATKTFEDLNLEQIPGYESLENPTIAGWDSHESCLRREKIRDTINNILSTAERLKEKERGDDIYFLNEIMNRAGLDQQYHTADPSHLKKKFLQSCEEYAEKVRSFSTWKEFPLRQESLEFNVHRGLEKTDTGYLFVLTGKLHVDLENSKTAAFAEKLFSSLPSNSYWILDFPPSSKLNECIII